MRNIWVALVCAALVACGSDGKDSGSTDGGNHGPDAKQFLDAAPTMNAMVTVSGQATARDAQGSMPVAGVTVAAYRNADENTPIATTTTDAQGNYSLVIQTNGEAIDGFLKATKGTTYKTTYLYPPYPFAMDFNMASVILVTPGTYDTLSNISGGGQQPGKGLVAMIVTDGTNPVAGATISTSPAGTYRYNGLVGSVALPTSTATSTYTDGVAYAFNVAPGPVTVSASKTGSTFASHPVKAWADDLVTTVIVPP